MRIIKSEGVRILDRQEIIDRCEEILLRRIIPMLKNDAKLLAELEQVKAERQWITVSERLPEKDTLVLLFLQSENQSKITTGKIYTSDNPKFDGQFCVGFDTLSPGFLRREVVTHWMPLPEAPKL